MPLVVGELFRARHALIGSSVRVHLQRDRSHVSGVLYSMDPESGDVALLRAPTSDSESESIPIKIVLGHTIRDIDHDESDDDITIDSIRALLRKKDSIGVDERESDPTALVAELTAFLDERFIPCASESTTSLAIFGGAATLRHPFQVHNIRCGNEQILRRLQQLVREFHAHKTHTLASS